MERFRALLDEIKQTEEQKVLSVGELVGGEQDGVLVGVVQFKPSSEMWDTLYLSDERVNIQLVLLQPPCIVLNSTILIKKWNYIHGMYIEAVDYRIVSERRIEVCLSEWIANLKQCFFTIGNDLPLLTGRQSVYQLRNPSVNVSKKIKYAALGRISAVSPIRRQKAKSYFVLELVKEVSECTANTVHILFMGQSKWHPFLHPDQYVLCLDLLKSFSTEAEKFVLQASEFTQVLFISPSEAIQILDEMNRSNYLVIGRDLVNYTGTISKRLSQDVFQLDQTLVLWLTHFSDAKRYAGLRVGAKLNLINVHVTDSMAIIACARSSIEIVAFSTLISSPSFEQMRSIRSSKLDLNRFSVPEIIWITKLVQTLGEIAPNLNKSRWILTMAAACGVVHKTVPSLFTRFIQADDCFSAQDTIDLPLVVSIDKLRQMIKDFIFQKELMDPTDLCFDCRIQRDRNTRLYRCSSHLSFIVPSNELGVMVLAYLVGNISKGEVRLCDQTGTLPVHVDEKTFTTFGQFPLVQLLQFEALVQLLPVSDADQLWTFKTQSFYPQIHLRVKENGMKCFARPEIEKQHDIQVYVTSIPQLNRVVGVMGESQAVELCFNESPIDFCSIKAKQWYKISTATPLPINGRIIIPTDCTIAIQPTPEDEQRYLNIVDTLKGQVINLIGIVVSLEYCPASRISIGLRDVNHLDFLQAQVPTTWLPMLALGARVLFHSVEVSLSKVHLTSDSFVTVLEWGSQHQNHFQIPAIDPERVYLSTFYTQDVADCRVFRVQGMIVDIHYILLAMRCVTCGKEFESGLVCKTGCPTGATLKAKAMCLLDDGSAQVNLAVYDTQVWNLLSVQPQDRTKYTDYICQYGPMMLKWRADTMTAVPGFEHPIDFETVFRTVQVIGQYRKHGHGFKTQHRQFRSGSHQLTTEAPCTVHLIALTLEAVDLRQSIRALLRQLN